jgi:hypothetical protein
MNQMTQRTKMDASASFLSVYGKGTTYRVFTADDDERLCGRIPEPMRKLLRQDGWCSYAEQTFWLCDPDDWIPAIKAWLPESGAWVIGRSSFGDQLAWDGTWFLWVLVHDFLAMRLIDDPEWLFSRTLTSEEFSLRRDMPGRTRLACRTAGCLEWDEIYTYIPALALGGSAETSRVERVKALPALGIMAALAPVRMA